MTTGDRDRKDKRGAIRRRLWLFASVAVGLMVMAGCGKRYIDLTFERPSDYRGASWVGVYLLSDEAALDDFDNVELADYDRRVEVDGIVDQRVFAVYSGKEPKPIQFPSFSEDVCCVVVAAGLPGDEECARQQIEVEPGAELTLIVTVKQDCIEITRPIKKKPRRRG